MEKLKRHKRLHRDIESFDPNFFFSYDGGENVFYYLPSLNAYVTTQDVSLDINDEESSDAPIVLEGVYPDYIEDHGFPLPNRIPSVYVNTSKYVSSDFEKVLAAINNEKLRNPFKIWPPKDANYPGNDYEKQNVEFDFARELVANRYVEVGNPVNTFRIANGCYLLSDRETKQNIKCRDIGEGFEILYGIK